MKKLAKILLALKTSLLVVLAGMASYPLATDFVDNSKVFHHVKGQFIKNFIIDADQYDNAVNSVVLINNSIGHGTGFFIDDNTIITNFHVVDNAEPKYVQFNDGTIVPAEMVWYEREYDLAILKCAAGKNLDGRARLPLAKGNAKREASVYTVGNPRHAGFDNFKTGKVWNTYPIIHKPYGWDARFQFIKIDIRGGQSGSPVMNYNGEVVGVLNASIGEMALMIPVEYIQDILKRVKK